MTATVRWLLRSHVCKLAAHGYTHLVRADDDPARSGSDLTEGRGWLGYDLKRDLAKGSHVAFLAPIVALLSDGAPRTFNRIAVELLDVTADVAFGTVFEDALHELFEQQEIQMSDGVPTYWRAAPATVCRISRRPTRDGVQGDLFT